MQGLFVKDVRRLECRLKFSWREYSVKHDLRQCKTLYAKCVSYEFNVCTNSRNGTLFALTLTEQRSQFVALKLYFFHHDWSLSPKVMQDYQVKNSTKLIKKNIFFLLLARDKWFFLNFNGFRIKFNICFVSHLRNIQFKNRKEMKNK